MSKIPANILSRYVKIKREMGGIAEKEREYKKNNKLEFFRPIEPYQTKIFEYLYGGKKVVTLQGGNAIGKTHLGAAVIGSACLGVQPWDGKDPVWAWGLNKKRKAVKCRILCTDWEKHAKTVMVPKLKEMFPVDEYETSKNNIGVEAFFTFKSGSTIELITNKQGTEDHEGWEGDFVWADEPFSQDKFEANLRGLRKAKENLEEDDPGMGVFLITMTAVSESWMLDEIILNAHPNYGCVTEIPMRANPYLSKEYQDTFASSLREEAKVARIEGGWLNLVGLIWKGFKSDVHVIDDFDIPTDWPVLAMIDFHPSVPQAISFFAVDPQGRYYYIKECFLHLSPEEVSDYIIRAKQQNTWRIEEAYIDPLSKGDVAYMKNRHGDEIDAFTKIKERLYRHGIDLQVASKDKSSGIINVESLLMGPNKMPILFFFKSACHQIKNEGIIWEIQRWNYDEDQMPKKENDHFCENMYRMTLTGFKYRPPRPRDFKSYAETDFDVFAPGFGV